MGEKVGSEYVKKETALLIAVVAVVAGFLSGIVFSVYYTGSGQTIQSSSPPPPPSGQAQGLTSQQAGSILTLEKEVAANPDNATAWTQLGHIYFDTNKPPKAIRAYEKSLALQPDNPNVLTDLGVMYRRNGQPDKALEVFDKAIALNPRHEQARFNKGIVLKFDLNDREGAIQAWEELLKINPAATLSNGQPVREAIKTL
jgi:cytochrome c-type biogenesis protein CcmH/NrfG